MLVIFDWDGTLSDSTGKIVRCVHRAAEDLSLPALQDAEVREIIGLSLNNAVAQLYPDLDPEGVNALAAAYSEHYVNDEHVPAFYDGAMEALHALRDKGYLLAVATGKSRKGLTRVLAQMALTGFFDATRCADETASKPSPLMLEELLVECCRRHDQAVMIGDTEFDLAMAKALKMPCIGVNYGAHHPSRFTPYTPLLCVDNLQDILPVIDRLARVE